jgi:hypothetical protein
MGDIGIIGTNSSMKHTVADIGMAIDFLDSMRSCVNGFCFWRDGRKQVMSLNYGDLDTDRTCR